MGSSTPLNLTLPSNLRKFAPSTIAVAIAAPDASAERAVHAEVVDGGTGCRAGVVVDERDDDAARCDLQPDLAADLIAVAAQKLKVISAAGPPSLRHFFVVPQAARKKGLPPHCMPWTVAGRPHYYIPSSHILQIRSKGEREGEAEPRRPITPALARAGWGGFAP